MNKILSLGIAFVMALSAQAGCSGPAEAPAPSNPVHQKPMINFEGIVSAVEDGTITLEDGTVVLITEDTSFAGDPDTGNAVSRDIQVGSFIQGYARDGADDGRMTASNIWTDLPAAEQ